MVKASLPAFAVTAAAIIAQNPANAWFRLLCSGNALVRERVDPIIQPGVSPSYHVHTVEGGSNFAPNSTFDTLRASECTSCIVKEDKSNYWFPQLYFHSPTDNLFYSVPNGGLDAYYQQRGTMEKVNGGPGLKAFPEGFKMLTGSPVNRRDKSNDTGVTDQQALASKMGSWVCLRYGAGGTDLYSDEVPGQGFPQTDCESGFQTRLRFPSCWDGVNVDSDDHNSHVAYLSGLDNGECPDTHPVGIVSLFYEVTWDIDYFVRNGKWTPDNTTFPFVYATGDPTGWSWHGDFQNGWDVTVQQAAIDNCNDQSNPDQEGGVVEGCPEVTVQAQDVYSSCSISPIVDEDIGETTGLAKLPGCNPIQDGPDDATIYSQANCPI